MTADDLIPDAGQLVRITGVSFSPVRRVERMLCEVVTVTRTGIPCVKVWPVADVDDDVTGGKWWFRLADIEAVELA